MKNNPFSVLCLLLMLFSQSSWSGNAKHPDDPHYTNIGFFDIHVCNWPDRPPFYMALYSTAQYNNVASVEIFSPGNKPVGQLDLNKFRVIEKDGKVVKYVFISKLPLPETVEDGWFNAKVKLKDGGSDAARDFVIHQSLPRATGMEPANNAEDVAVPKQLHWSPIDGAAYYQVYIRDLWDGEKLIYSSKLLNENKLDLPTGTLKPGGLYAWRVHARDVNEHIQLGDFNIGSLSEWIEFSVADN